MPRLSRFFVEHVHATGDRVTIGGSDAHKIVNVLRLRTGDEIEVTDSGGTLFVAGVECDGEAVHATLKTSSQAPAVDVRIDVAQGIPKGQKMDFVIEKLTELGVETIVPFESEHTVVRDVGSAKLERWRRLAKTAAQQCGRLSIPSIGDPISFEELCGQFSGYDRVLIPWEVAAGEALRDRLPELVAGARSILVVIGPEGGFSHDEVQRAQHAGAHPLSLGRRILRTETAALVMVSILTYFFGL